MRFLRFVVIGAIVLAAARTGFFAAQDWYNAKSRNPDAQAAGFIDYREMDAAKAAGFTNPEAYRAAMTWVDQARKQAEIKKLDDKIAADAAALEARRNPADMMSVTTISWTPGGFGTVAIMTLAVSNENDFPVKDIQIKCSFTAKSGTEVSTASHTIYDTIKAKTKRTFKDVNVGFIHSQAARGGCSPTRASRL